MNIIDTYFNHRPSKLERFRTSTALCLSMSGCRTDPSRPQHWIPVEKQQMGGLVTLEPSDESAGGIDPEKDIVVSTVRMGYGHHRIALSICSHAKACGRRALLLDFLASSRDEAKAIRRMDSMYSLMSRLSADFGGSFEALWGRMMKSGDVGAARLANMMASKLDALLSDIPADIPYISAYPLNGHLAVKLGFKNVVNLIFDNDPQHFLIVPGTLNLVQTRSSYERLRILGVPKEEVAIAGHWVSRDLLENIDKDASIRIKRAVEGIPGRLLLTIGGAGAQKKYILKYLKALKPLLDEGRIRILVNIGDHSHFYEPLIHQLRGTVIEHEDFRDTEDMEEFINKYPMDDYSSEEKMAPVSIFSFQKHFDAVSATDRLMRFVDLLVTKPSELAFVPVPKLHLRRVGDHEAASARRSAEIGDGTLECREIDDALKMTTLFVKSPEFSVPMNESIMDNARRGLYSGSEVAVRKVIETDEK